MDTKATYSIQGIEVFSEGTWNGDTYTKEDLQEMVDAFEETKKGVRPYLKLGHDEKQNLLQQDGLPAAGWIERVYIQGEKLMADFIDIPKKIYDLIQTKAYRKVSSEIYWNLKVGEKVYKRFLGAVALLGSDMPGCMNLSDILGQYRMMTNEPPKIYSNCEDILFEIKQNSITIEKEGEIMPTEKELQLEAELKTFKANAEAEANKAKALENENAELKKFKADQEVLTAKAIADAKIAADEAFISKLESENLCTPAMKPYVAALIGEDKKEYSIKIKDEETKLPKRDLLKETLKLFKAIGDVNLDERSTSGDKDSVISKEQETKIEKYIAEHKCTYGQAVKAILATK